MKKFSAQMTAALDGPVTTLAECWRLTRADGTVLGFTDHDSVLEFDGTRFEPSTGFSAGAAESELGLATTTREVAGALSSAAITEADILAGRYDGARVETFLADWTEAEAAHALTGFHHLGEVRHGDLGYTAELRGRFADLDRVRGRLYRRRCDAVFGDARCGVDLEARDLVHSAVALSGEGLSLVLAAWPADASGNLDDFVAGTLTVDEGTLAGLSREIASVIRRSGGTAGLRITESLPEPLIGPVTVRLTEGCDKRFATCRDRYANAVNFRGFPHMPGNDAALQVAKADVEHDGRPLVP